MSLPVSDLTGLSYTEAAVLACVGTLRMEGALESVAGEAGAVESLRVVGRGVRTVLGRHLGGDMDVDTAAAGFSANWQMGQEFPDSHALAPFWKAGVRVGFYAFISVREAGEERLGQCFEMGRKAALAWPRAVAAGTVGSLLELEVARQEESLRVVRRAGVAGLRELAEEDRRLFRRVTAGPP
ncbi:hypothetical protein [Streptomyces sp. NPDC048659]|uniref:hypothetical protein n=1 Tax=Streptomyces sp. NPDC048659 TaxID=3155489 RepID=UPI003418F905